MDVICYEQLIVFCKLQANDFPARKTTLLQPHDTKSPVNDDYSCGFYEQWDPIVEVQNIFSILGTW